ncbi:hypothetical protein EYC84_005480 [Monilinia fructicola]|uniref:Uncharacterized protein n=1 Tax=Monilinia fructicola TaxID=38448 RepID=A0A5M9JWM9_MONFR|nr:hypothetical protein EYC84_005480 [Monilinia fructicola]
MPIAPTPSRVRACMPPGPLTIMGSLPFDYTLPGVRAASTRLSSESSPHAMVLMRLPPTWLPIISTREPPWE